MLQEYPDGRKRIDPLVKKHVKKKSYGYNIGSNYGLSSRASRNLLSYGLSLPPLIEEQEEIMHPLTNLNRTIDEPYSY
jgi:restriction endonuclease S subunit